MAFPGSEGEIIQARKLLKTLAQWIATYEQWVNNQFGREYRRKVFRAWHKRPVVSPDALAIRWQHFAEELFPATLKAA